MSLFQTTFTKKHRPEIQDLNSFWNQEIADLFRNFANDILKKYDLRFAVPTWKEANGTNETSTGT